MAQTKGNLIRRHQTEHTGRAVLIKRHGGLQARRRVVQLLFAVLLLCPFTGSLRAQQTGNDVQSSHASAPAEDSQKARLANLEKQVADARSVGDNSWMLTSSALVLLMTGPGLALFYGGLVRKKKRPSLR